MSLQVRRPMWVKLAVVSMALAAGPTVFVGLGLMDINAEALRTESRDFRLAIAEDIAESVDTELRRAQGTVAGVAHVLGAIDVPAQGRIPLAQTLIGLDPSVDYVDVYDAQRRHIDRIVEVGVEPPAIVASLSQTPEPLRIANQLARVPIVVPIHPEAPTGYVLTYVPLAQVQEHLQGIATNRLPRGASLFAVAEDATIVMHQDASKVGTLASSNEVLRDLPGLVAQRVAASGETNSGTRLTSVRPLSSLPWVVVVELPLDVAYASLSKMRWVVAVATVLASLVAAVAAFLAARVLTRPLMRLLDMVQRLADRDFSARTDVATSDEVGVLAGALNAAATDLQSSEAQIREEIAIRADLSRYLSKELVENVVAREQDMNLGGQHQEITVLFADVVRFTPMCEALDAQDVVRILNELFTMLTEIVFKHGGTVDKFVGDCVMAFWGAPKPDAHHAAHALNAAEEMLSWLEINNARWQKHHNIKIELAIGVNSGRAIVGNVGSKTRMEYTAIGNIVNVAARLEALARPQQILTTHQTRALAQDRFEFLRIGDEPIGANQAPIEVFEVVV